MEVSAEQLTLLQQSIDNVSAPAILIGALFVVAQLLKATVNFTTSLLTSKKDLTERLSAIEITLESYRHRLTETEKELGFYKLKLYEAEKELQDLKQRYQVLYISARSKIKQLNSENEKLKELTKENNNKEN